MLLTARAFSQVMPEKALKVAESADEAAFLDSLAEYYFAELPSNLTIRMGFTPHVYFAGRDYGINQYSFMPSITYNHKSGLYADITGISYSSSAPMYEITLASVGYMGMAGSNFLYFGEYSRSFYLDATANAANTVPNSISAFATYDLGGITPILGYSLLFGSESVHRIMPGISTRFKTGKVGFINNISFSPSISATLGSSKSYSNTVQTTIQTRIKQILAGRGGGAIPTPTVVETVQNNFGLMAFTVALPIAITVQNFRISITNNFIKPVKLYSTEDITTKWVYGLNASISYSVDW